MASGKTTECLESTRRLLKLMPSMTLGELEEALEIEHGTRRRPTVTKRLAMRINKLKSIQLKKEYT